jgi:protease-4
MFSIREPFTPAQRARVNALLDNTYHSFISDVAAARRIPIEKMPDIAKGRVWTGDQAIKVGLVDELGGYDVAMASLRKVLKIDDNKLITLENFPSPPTPAEKLMKLLHRLNSDSAMLGNEASLISRLQSTLAPWLHLAALTKPVSAKADLEVLHE